jgi:hypothetical protein
VANVGHGNHNQVVIALCATDGDAPRNSGSYYWQTQIILVFAKKTNSPCGTYFHEFITLWTYAIRPYYFTFSNEPNGQS